MEALPADAAIVTLDMLTLSIANERDERGDLCDFEPPVHSVGHLLHDNSLSVEGWLLSSAIGVSYDF